MLLSSLPLALQRWLIVAVFSIWFCIAMVFAAQLEPSKSVASTAPSSLPSTFSFSLEEGRGGIALSNQTLACHLCPHCSLHPFAWQHCLFFSSSSSPLLLVNALQDTDAVAAKQ